MLLVAILLWVGYGVMVWQLSAERERYATLQSDIASRQEEEEVNTRLRTLVRDTTEERDVLQALTQTDILTAVSTIEAAGRASGTNLTIQNVTEPSGSAGGVRTVTLTTHAEGSVSALIKTLVLLESLPFPSVVESVRFEANDTPQSTRTNTWQMTTRLHVITTSPFGT